MCRDRWSGISFRISTQLSKSGKLTCCKDYPSKQQVALAASSSAMKTAISNYTIKSASRFLQALFLLVLTLALAIGSQPALAQTAPCTLSDIDRDDDGLIEICDLEGLDAVRFQLDGTGYKASGSATKITAGCPNTGCKGYELTQDLDFNDDNSYSSTANKITWTTGTGWDPIGYYESHNDGNNNLFTATFDGNNHIISNLMINNSQIRSAGLFSGMGRQSKIINTGLLNINVKLTSLYPDVGGLVGYNKGNITNSYATGSVIGTSFCYC